MVTKVPLGSGLKEYLNIAGIFWLLTRLSACSRCLCEPMNCSPPGSSVHGVLQARRLERLAIAFSRGSSHPRN